MLKISSIILLTLTVLLVTNVQAYPINVTDNFGDTVTIEKPPERIVSLSPSNTEILFAVGAGDKVVAGTKHDAYPPEARDLPKVGDFASVNIEAVVNMSPDIVLAQWGNGEDTINMLKGLNLTVVVLHPKTMDDILENIRLVGQITGNEENATLLTAKMTQQIENITSQTENIPDDKRPRVLYLVWHDPMYGAGTDTFPSDLIKMSGGKNIVETEGWPIISVEQVVAKNPQIIITSGMGGMSPEIKNATISNPVLAQTDAVKNQKVYPIADPNIIELPGSRIVQGLTELHSYIAPEVQLNNSSSTTSIEESQTPGFGILLGIIMLLAVYLRIK